MTKDKAEKEAQKAKDKLEKEAKKAKKSGKSKASTPPLLLTETSFASQSQNPRKRDASIAQLSMLDCSRSHHRPSCTLQGGVCMCRSSSLEPFCPLMHILCSRRPSPRNGWI
jgi:hypothetical protein